jgi:hypothetical protein
VPFDLKSWLSQKLARDKPAPLTIAPASHKSAEAFHAVSIKPGHQCCQGAKQFTGIRFLGEKAPKLPLPDCQAPVCNCRYVHHADRRSGEERRGERGWQQKQDVGIERRQRTRGRRATDPVDWNATD